MFTRKEPKIPPISVQLVTNKKDFLRDKRELNSTQNVQKKSNDQPIFEKIILLWLDSSINESDKEWAHSLKKLRGIIHTVHTYTNVDKFISFVKNIKDQTIFVVISGSLGEQIIGNIHAMNQIDAIYVFCGNVDKHKQWTKKWFKIKDVCSDIRLLCQAVRNNVRQTDRDSTSVQFVHSKDANLINPTFMYTTLFKEIIIELKYDQQSMDSLVKECSNRCKSNETQLKIIQEFRNEYHNHTPVWWYTRECFLYQILNQALRTFEVDIILVMGVFIRDLHHRIEQLHSQQKHNFPNEFIVYRGQGLLKKDFEILKTSRGGFFTFNSFLSTSQQRKVSYNFACDALNKVDHVAILFRMTIKSSINKAPFAVLGKESYFKEEEQELLFSMNCIFRIGHVKELEIKNLFEVELILTTPEIDGELLQLTKQLRSEINGPTAMHRMAHLLLGLKYPKKAQELYQSLLDKTPNTNYDELSHLYLKLGMAYSQQDQYENAIKFLQKAIDIRQKYLPRSYLEISICYNQLGEVYESKQECVKALSYFGKALEIRENFVPEENVQLSGLYFNIGRMHYRLNEHSKACEYFLKVLEIRAKFLPATHPDLAEIYRTLGTVFSDMGHYKDAFKYLQTAYDMFTKSLPSNHNLLIRINYEIGVLLVNMGEVSQAFEYFENGTKIGENSLFPDDSELLMCYRGMGSLYHTIGNFNKALEYWTKELNLRKKADLSDNLELAENYDNVGISYGLMREDKKALECLEKSLQIKQNLNPPDYESLSFTYHKMAIIYQSVNNSSKALQCAEKFIEMKEKSTTSNLRNMIPDYEYIVQIYIDAKEYSKALQYQQKTHDILKKTIVHSNTKDLADSYQNMAFLHGQLQQYVDAFKCIEESMEIKENLVYLEKEFIINEYLNLGNVCRGMGLYSKLFRWGRKLLDFIKKYHPIDRSTLTNVYQNIGLFYYDMKNYTDALKYWQKELESVEQISPKNDSALFMTHYLLSIVYSETKDISKANIEFKKCFDIQKASPGISTSCHIIFYLGNIYHFMGDHTKAISFFNRTLDMAKTTVSETDIFFADILSEMGNVQQVMGDYNNALVSLQKAIEIQKNTFSPRIDLARTYNYMGETYQKMKNYQVAVQCFVTALKIQEKFTPEKHPELATTYHHLAQVYRDMKQTKQAFEYAQKSVEIARHWWSETHPLYVKYKQTLTQIQQNV